jgi:transglutaminase-like putative cysteine protease
MNNKSCSRVRLTKGNRTRDLVAFTAVAVVALVWSAPARADVPAWMRSVASNPLPKYSAETNAVLLYDETTIAVKDAGEVHSIHRRVYRILRPSGRDRGVFNVSFDKETKVISMRAWSLPANGGKEFEVKEKDAVETQLTEGDLYSDTRHRILRIPAADPGATIAYEYEQRERPYILQDIWWFQSPDPVRQSRFILQLPPGWRYKAAWIHHEPVVPQEDGNNQLHWELGDISAVEEEAEMPPVQSIEGRMVVNYFPAAGTVGNSMDSWQDVGKWYTALTGDRRISSVEIKKKVEDLAGGSADTLGKLRALAGFVQKDIRYVAIEIGVGGYQPHPAASVFSNRYGDCKDKATLLAAMLHEIGIDSFYVLVNTRRGVVTPEYPPGVNFNHVILAITLPSDASAGDLYAIVAHPRYGKLLLFDPTSTLTPLGDLPFYEQSNYGMLTAADGGELVRMPLLPPSVNRLSRTARLTLSPDGSITGSVEELRNGDPAESSRARLLAAQGGERAKVLESFIGSSVGGFTLTKATVGNLEAYDQMLILNYQFVAPNYAQTVGNLLLVRPRVLGGKASTLLEEKERKYPVEFDTATLQTDQFDLTLPQGYVPDELPPPVRIDFDFATYSSKVEMVSGNVLRYSRTYQVKEVVVPPSRLGDLKRFYRQILTDESSAAVFKKAGS